MRIPLHTSSLNTLQLTQWENMETHLKLQRWLLHSSAGWISRSLLSSQMSGKPWWISKSRNRSCPVQHTAAAFGCLPNTSSLGTLFPGSNGSVGALPWDFPLSWCYRGARSWAVPAPKGIPCTAGCCPLGWQLPLAVTSSEARTKRGGGCLMLVEELRGFCEKLSGKSIFLLGFWASF